MARSRISAQAFLAPTALLIIGVLMIGTAIVLAFDLFMEEWVNSILPSITLISFIAGVTVGCILAILKRWRWLLLCYPAAAIAYSFLLPGEYLSPLILWIVVLFGYAMPTGGGLAAIILGLSMLSDQVRLALISQTE